jgi:hypothetical protein
VPTTGKKSLNKGRGSGAPPRPAGSERERGCGKIAKREKKLKEAQDELKALEARDY